MATTRIDIEGSASSFLNAAKQAEAALGRLQSNAQATTKSLGQISRSAELMGNALKGAFAVAIGGSLFNFVDALQNMENKLRVATKSQEEFNQANAYVKAIADKTGQSLAAIGDLYSKVAMNADKLGYSTEQVATVTNAFATALKVSGASAQGSASSIYQFSQILAKGKVNGDEFTTIMENLGGPVMDLVAKNMGVTTAELIKLKEKGLIGAKDFTDALIRSMDQLAVMGGKVAPTVGQALQRIQNSFASLLLELERSTGVFSKLATSMDFLAKNIDTVLVGVAAMTAVFVVGRFAAIAAEVHVLARSMGILAAVMNVIGKSPIMIVLSGIVAAATYFAGKSLFGDAPKEAGDLAAAAKKANEQISQTPGQLTGVTDKYQLILRDVKEQLNVSGLVGDELKIQNQLLQYNTQLERKMTAEQRSQLEGILRQIDANQKLAEVRKSISQLNIPKVGIMAELEVSSRLPQLDPMTAAITSNQTMFNGLKALRDQDLISEQQYQTMRVNAAVMANQQIMDATAQMYESKKLFELQSQQQSNFGYATQRQMAREYADFEMKSNMEKAQFAMEQTASVFSSLGAQNKKAFEASKALNIGMAIMNTYMGATKALATYPWPFGLIAAAAAVAAGMAQVAQIRSQSYSGRALGGPVMGGQSYIVGENGPELFTPQGTGSITRNSDLQGNGVTNINFNIQANDAQGFDDLIIQRRGMITQFVKDAMAEQGQRSKM